MLVKTSMAGAAKAQHPRPIATLQEYMQADPRGRYAASVSVLQWRFWAAFVGCRDVYLLQATVAFILDGVRRRTRQRTFPLDEEGADRYADGDPDPGQAVHDSLLDHDVQTALDALSPDFRAAVLLCDVQGLSYEEVGDELGIKLGTVRSRIHRGRRQMREALAHRDRREAEATPTP